MKVKSESEVAQSYHKKEQNNAICRSMDGPTHCHRHRKTDGSIAYVWNLKRKGTNELIYKTVESQIQKTNLCLPGDM